MKLCLRIIRNVNSGVERLLVVLSFYLINSARHVLKVDRLLQETRLFRYFQLNLNFPLIPIITENTYVELK